MNLEYRHVDVFSRFACQGNGLVVVLDRMGLWTVVQQVTGTLADRYREALGLPTSAVRRDLPIQVASTGLPYLIVPVQPEGLAAVAIQTLDFEALLALSGAKFVYVLDPATAEGRTWDDTGRVEDVATGSAAGPAAGWEDRSPLWPKDASRRGCLLMDRREHRCDVGIRRVMGWF